MKRLLSIVLLALMLASVPGFAEEVSVTGFWYSEEDDTGIEMQDDGAAILSDANGETVAIGVFTADGADVTITAGDQSLRGTVVGNTMQITPGDKQYIRDGIEVGYWTNDTDGTALELYDGQVWHYNEVGDLLSEGTYTIAENTVTIELDGDTMVGVIQDAIMTIDGVSYIPL